VGVKVGCRDAVNHRGDRSGLSGRNGRLISLRRVEAVKLAQAGFEDFLADTHVSRLKGKRDNNIEVYFFDTISNSAGHK